MARRVLHDHYFRLAKAEGYAARSAYKLTEINERKRLIQPGDAVLDLGCAPGAWLQVASKIVGPRGAVVGVDLKAVELVVAPNVRTVVGDARAVGVAELLPGQGRLFDVVLSDMAPNTSGHGDDFVSAALCRDVLARLGGLLRPGGNLAMKIFEGALYADVLGETSALFAAARGFKPKASRDISREMYIVAHDFRPSPARGERRP